MKKVKWFLLVIMVLVLAHCTPFQTAKLVKNEVSPEYLQKKYGTVSRSSVYFTPKFDFDTLIRLTKESIVASNLPKEEMQKQFDEINGLQFDQNRYLVYFFRLKSPAPVSQDDVKITFNDKDGNSIVEKTIQTNNKVTTTMTGKYGTSTDISYNYAWIMKLKKPFIKENYPTGKYPVSVTYENGQKALYELEL